MLRKLFNKIIEPKVQDNESSSCKDDSSISVDSNSELGFCTDIGYGTNINGPVFIASTKNAPVSIGKYCAIAHNLRVRPRNHYTGYANLQDKFQEKYGFPNLNSIKGPVKIGNNVWIADNVIILSGVTIGNGAVIGAGAIVTKDVPAFSIAAGNPAKVVKKRFSDEVIEQLEKIQWWDWDEQKIIQNRRFFETDLSQLDALNIRNLVVD